MYYPYLRGKREELSALHELQSLLVASRKVCPIIEPVTQQKRGKNPFGRIVKIAAAGYPVGVIVNPAKGNFVDHHDDIRDRLFGEFLAPFENVVPTLLVGPNSSHAQVARFLAEQSGPVGIVHAGEMGSIDQAARLLRSERVRFQLFRSGRTGKEYVSKFPRGASVVLQDGFNRAAKNEEYPKRELFSDLIYAHRDEGYDGFGDFQMIGDFFRKGGGLALAVALHLTNLEGRRLFVYHFVSDDVKGRGVDTAKKFLQALLKLVAFVQSPKNNLVSEGCRDYLDLAQREHYPGLGMAKRLSIKHHVELIARAL